MYNANFWCSSSRLWIAAPDEKEKVTKNNFGARNFVSPNVPPTHFVLLLQGRETP
jgi:hypothetical protein